MFLLRASLVSAVACLAAPALPALAEDVTFTVGTPTNTTPGAVVFTLRGVTTSVPIPPGTTASAKRTLIKNAIAARGFATINGPSPASATITGLNRTDTFSISTGNTGEAIDVIAGTHAGSGVESFTGHFAAFDSVGQPAVFTAGIVTDVGLLTEQVSASELNFQTDGPIICQALFQRLAPRAPQYGAQINYASDRLEVYFDPAYTATTGGVIFGTTSQSPGCTGTLELNRALRHLSVSCSNSTNFVIAPELVSLGLSSASPISIPPFSSAIAVADALRNGLHTLGHRTATAAPGSFLVLMDLSQGVADFQHGMTGQAMTLVQTERPRTGTARFTGFFQPFSTTNQPAIFTAGIVTDLGMLTEQVSASELDFQTDGPIICQALFQRLAPRAPQYGAQINYASDRLEVYFDPAYTATTGGVIFGTTSPSPGCAGGLNFVPRAPLLQP